MTFTHEQLLDAVRKAGRDGKPFGSAAVREQLGMHTSDRRELEKFQRRFRAFQRSAAGEVEKVATNMYRLANVAAPVEPEKVLQVAPASTPVVLQTLENLQPVVIANGNEDEATEAVVAAEPELDQPLAWTDTQAANEEHVAAVTTAPPEATETTEAPPVSVDAGVTAQVAAFFAEEPVAALPPELEAHVERTSSIRVDLLREASDPLSGLERVAPRARAVARKWNKTAVAKRFVSSRVVTQLEHAQAVLASTLRERSQWFGKRVAGLFNRV